MRTLLRSVTLLLLVVALVSNCKQSSTLTPTPPVVVPQAQPSLTSISPLKAVAGTELTITGQNLQNTREVTFNGQSVRVNSADNTASVLKVVAPALSLSGIQTVNVGVSTSGGLSNTLSLTVAPQSEITQSPVPNGLIPGGPLSLTVNNTSEIISVDFMNENNEVKATVSASSFLTNSSGRIMLKVPVGVSTGWIRINTDYGYGKPRSISVMAGIDQLTTSNIATSVGAIATGVISNACNPSAMFYGVPLPKGKGNTYPEGGKTYPVGFYIKQYEQRAGGKPDGGIVCGAVDYSIKDLTTIPGILYHEFTGFYGVADGNGGTQRAETPYITLRLERNKSDDGYTGSALIAIGDKERKITHVGHMLISGDIIAYSLSTGEEIRLCKKSSFGQLTKDKINSCDCP